MSLINEALKRTRDASYRAGTPSPVAAEPYRVTQNSPRKRQGISPVVWIVAVAAVVVGAVAMQSLQAVPVVESAPSLPKRAKPVVVVVPPAPVPEVVVVPPAPPEPPKLALQGITVDATGREALVNGVTVRVGEIVDGAKVTGIEARVVRLEFAGKEIQLRMP